MLVGFKNAFHVSNRYADAYFACDKELKKQEWIDAISKIKMEKKINIEDEFDDLDEAGSSSEQ